MSNDKVFDGLGQDEENTTPEEGENTSSEAEAPQEESSKPTTKAERTSKAAEKAAATRKRNANKAEADHIIRLHDSAEFPPGGLTVGVNGKFYRLHPDVDMEVPESVMEVLDHAVRTEARRNEHGQVVGARNVPRFPYTMVRRK